MQGPNKGKTIDSLTPNRNIKILSDCIRTIQGSIARIKDKKKNISQLSERTRNAVETNYQNQVDENNIADLSTPESRAAFFAEKAKIDAAKTGRGTGLGAPPSSIDEIVQDQIDEETKQTTSFTQLQTLSDKANQQQYEMLSKIVILFNDKFKDKKIPMPIFVQESRSGSATPPVTRI